jgi:Zn-dependent protease
MVFFSPFHWLVVGKRYHAFVFQATKLFEPCAVILVSNGISRAVPGNVLAVGGLTSILFFGSVLLHELGHSLLAIRNKIPVHSITLFIFSGVARISREPQSPGVEFRIAIAGPLVSLGLAGIFGLL